MEGTLEKKSASVSTMQKGLGFKQAVSKPMLVEMG